MPKASITTPKDLESSLKELNEIVEKMEKGGLSLEDSLAQFEKGVALIRFSQELLKQADQKIAIYNQEKNKLEPFEENKNNGE
jgi:exodeoxyribonuclease VII small subunit